MTTGKFAGLSLAVDKPFKCELLNPITDLPIRDKDGNTAFVAVLSDDSRKGRLIDSEILSRRLNSKKRHMDATVLTAEQIDKMAALTIEWFLIDFEGNVLDISCTEAAARELYSEAETAWIFEQVKAASLNKANFKKG